MIGKPGANLSISKFAAKVGHCGGGGLDCGYKDEREVMIGIGLIASHLLHSLPYQTLPVRL
jgi:hypothetical protein